MSHLTRGAWIEIGIGGGGGGSTASRTSHEVRGLKYEVSAVNWPAYESHLTRGAWIEI